MVHFPVWVMNVVPVDSAVDTLGVIYERGLIGTYQDWCEAFSTYPRTYDLIHADGVFSIYQDRILRPEGAVIIRDTAEVLVKVRSIIEGMRWRSQTVDHESGPFHPEKILVAVKSYWTGHPTPKQ
ncbi:putative methyltransferase PMT17 [Ananas comosus]|uniref:Methyltransferase n=1 Tax=Ananas comosus TaxID=4615 RepID=A0A199VEJ7_ANACO|nr:putative methyltransferase PMT17 [Ananas comosus]